MENPNPSPKAPLNYTLIFIVALALLAEIGRAHV